MNQQAVITSPTQTFLIAAVVAVGAAAVLQAPQVTSHLTSAADTAIELVAAALPADLGAAAMDAVVGQQPLPDAVDAAALDPMAFAPLPYDGGGVDLSSVLADLAQQVADPAAWVGPIAQGGDIINDLFNIVEDAVQFVWNIVEGVVQFVWNVITLPLRILEDIIGDIVGII